MPQKNTLKLYRPDTYYHVYFRGVNKQKIFNDDNDKRFFTSLFARYLSKSPPKSHRTYPSYKGDIELVAYCLMPNHVHLLLYQRESPEAVCKFMSSLLTSYSKYFNKRHGRVGGMFESRYKARDINSDAHLMHITRYIHMNPRRWESYRGSSLKFAFNVHKPDWISMGVIESEFKSKDRYIDFLREYQENKEALKGLKDQLANN